MENNQPTQNINLPPPPSKIYTPPNLQDYRKIYVSWLIIILVGVVGSITASGLGIFLGLQSRNSESKPAKSVTQGENISEDDKKTILIPQNYSVLFSVLEPDYTSTTFQSDIEGENLKILSDTIRIPILSTLKTNVGTDNSSQRFVTEDRNKLVTFTYANPSEVNVLYSIPDEKSGSLQYPVLSTDGKNLVFVEDLQETQASEYQVDQQEENNLYVISVEGEGLKKIYRSAVPNGYIVLYRYFSYSNEILMDRNILPDDTTNAEQKVLDFPPEIIDAESGSVKKVLTNLGKPALNSKYSFTKDLDKIYYLSGDKNNLQFMEYSISSNIEKVLYPVIANVDDEYIFDILISEKGDEFLLTIQNKASNKIKMQIVNIQAKTSKVIYDSSEFYLRPVSWSPDGNFIFTSINKVIDRNGEIISFNPQTNIQFKQTSEGKVSIDEIEFLGWIKN
jgi:hypothetical protein